MADLQTLGQYKLRRKIASGATGEVYEALGPKVNRPVAIKTIGTSYLNEEAAREYSVRFKEEAEAVARLDHPNIVRLYDLGEEGEVAFVVMELVRGKDLRSCFESGVRFEAREAVRMMRELLGALDYAHRAGIVHRDVKPSNILLDPEGRVKLAMDFAVARLIDTDRTGRTQVGAQAGTASYMSPEQVQGLAADPRSDVFSSGAVLYQLLTNRPAFTGDKSALLKSIVHEHPVKPSQIDASLPGELDRIVSSALAKAPEARYQSAADFGRALGEI
jgi:serine/threonine-protein kinase